MIEKMEGFVKVVEFSIRDEAGHKVCSDWKSYQRYLVLKDCGFDLAQVEAKVRSLYKRGTKISEVMKPYRDAYEKLVMGGNNGFFSGLTAIYDESAMFSFSL